MQKLPGTLGGMVRMNAGLKKWEIFNNLLAIRTEYGWISKEKIDFGYRHQILMAQCLKQNLKFERALILNY